MKEQSTEGLIESRPSWEDVEAFARQRIQTWFQRLHLLDHRAQVRKLRPD